MPLHRRSLIHHDISTSARIGRAIARLALAAAIICAIVALAAGPAYRFELLPLGTAFSALRGSVIAAIAAAATALLALLLLGTTRHRQGGIGAALGALLISATVATPPLLLQWQASSLPPIHDISTDLRTPPPFVAIEPLRRMAPNGSDYPAEAAAQQQAAYPDIKTFEIATAPAPTFERALRAAQAMGWQIVSVAPQDGRIEATARSLMFGFKDDVVIRVRPAPHGSQVDVRSASRIGRSDLGVNARRIRAYLREFTSAEASG